MTSKAKRNSEEKSESAGHLPVEEFARLVEGLDAADIESACVQDGASPGGVPPGWAGTDVMERCKERMGSATKSYSQILAMRCEWEEAAEPRIVARGNDLAAIGVSDGDQFDIDDEIEPVEGDLVVAEGPCGRLLRKLRVVGGASLLCAGNPERPAVAVADGLRVLGVAMHAKPD